MDTLATARNDLRLLTASDSTVRLGYTLSNGTSDKTDPMPAADAALYLDAMATTLDNFGITFSSLFVFRFDN